MLNTICKVAMAFGVAVLIGAAAVADERHPLVGNWKLVSWQVIGEDGKPQDVFGRAPSGYLVITPEGRSIVLTTATGRKPGTDDTAAPRFRNRCCHIAAVIASRAVISSPVSTSHGTRSGTARSKGVTTGSRATSSSSKLHQHPAWCLRAKRTSADSFGSASRSCQLLPHVFFGSFATNPAVLAMSGLPPAATAIANNPDRPPERPQSRAARGYGVPSFRWKPLTPSGPAFNSRSMSGYVTSSPAVRSPITRKMASFCVRFRK